jgi:hypothetical protein
MGFARPFAQFCLKEHKERREFATCIIVRNSRHSHNSRLISCASNDRSRNTESYEESVRFEDRRPISLIGGSSLRLTHPTFDWKPVPRRIQNYQIEWPKSRNIFVFRAEKKRLFEERQIRAENCKGRGAGYHLKVHQPNE